MFSSSPAVETSILAQKYSLVKFFFRLPNLRAIWITLLPFRLIVNFLSLGKDQKFMLIVVKA